MANAELTGKMKAVVDEVWSNPRVVLGGLQSQQQREKTGLLPCGGAGQFRLDVLACPVQPVYDPEELNDLMLEVVGTKPTCIDYFSLHFEGVDRPASKQLLLGRLGFEETVVNPSLAGMSLRQTTSLRLFPDAEHLLDAVEGRNVDDIPLSQLGHGGVRS